MRITAQEARSPKEQAARVRVPELVRVLIERIAWEARESDFVDRKSGVSARLTISALESAISAAERRTLRNGEERTVVRVGDLQAVVPAIIGKIELVYEGEQEGPEKIAHHLIGQAVRHVFAELFPDPTKPRKNKQGVSRPDAYQEIIQHFEDRDLEIALEAGNVLYGTTLRSVPGLLAMVRAKHELPDEDQLLWAEFVLHALAEHSRIGRTVTAGGARFGDLMNSMLPSGGDDDMV